MLHANPLWHPIQVELTAATTINTTESIVSLEMSDAVA